MNLNHFIAKAKDLKVLVIGETITDEFIDVNYQGQSMKSFCPVFQLIGNASVRQLGGAYAIFRHLEKFVGDISIVSNDPEEIIKTRYVDVLTGEKRMELNAFNLNQREPFHIRTEDYDVVILADFGHGFCDHIEISDGFHLMCQTNSHNFGFNRLSKWKHKRKSSVCVDLREAGLQLNKKVEVCSDDFILELFNYELNTTNLFVTTGKQGSVFTNGSDILRHPSYQTTVIDTIGAGDAFFAFASICASINIEGKYKLDIPSLAASLTTTWLCNENSVTPQNLSQHANQYL